MLLSWPSGSRLTVNLRLTWPTFSSACGDSRWECRALRLERFISRGCLRPLPTQPSYSLWATSPTGPRQLWKGGALPACSSLCSSAPLPEGCSWFTRTFWFPFCHSSSLSRQSPLRRSSLGTQCGEVHYAMQHRKNLKDEKYEDTTTGVVEGEVRVSGQDDSGGGAGIAGGPSAGLPEVWWAPISALVVM